MNMDQPLILKLFDGGEGRVLRAGAITVTRLAYQPGWRWSDSHHEMIGMRWCQHGHRGYVISGALAVTFSDGERLELAAGDAFDLPPGHDQEVLGDEPCVLLEITVRPAGE
jgi:hypothetical protein